MHYYGWDCARVRELIRRNITREALKPIVEKAIIIIYYDIIAGKQGVRNTRIGWLEYSN